MDKHLCEELLTAFAAENKRFAVTILRSCVVIGPNANNYVVRAFFKPILVGVLGYNPHLQFIHESDLARVLALMVMEPRPGVYNVAVAGALRYTRVARLAGRKVLFLPAFVAYPLVELTWKLGFQRESPSIGLNFIRYPIVLSTEKLTRETGFTPQYSAEEALLSYVRAHS
jgi:UDP-glucose 4-epimerase